MKKLNEETLNRWLNDELEGEELLEAEAWASKHAEELDNELKCDIGWEALTADLRKVMLASEEPPLPEFFNSKLQKAIQDEMVEKEAEPAPVKLDLWRKVSWMLLPAAAAAAIAFYAGGQMAESKAPRFAQSAQISSMAAIDVVYVPHSGVVAAIAETEKATEIVLEGLSPISDDLDIVNVGFQGSGVGKFVSSYLKRNHAESEIISFF